MKTITLQKPVCRTCLDNRARQNGEEAVWVEADDLDWENEEIFGCPNSAQKIYVPHQDARNICTNLPAHQGCVFIMQEETV